MIEVHHLTKQYGDHLALNDLSFTAEPGRIYGFLGPNGAGKSTAMNIMTGCLSATSGEVTIGGHDIFEEPVEAKKLIGYLPELPPLYQDMTPLEYLDFVAKAKGIRGRTRVGEEVSSVMEKTGILEVRDRLMKNLSKGYRQRVGIAQALLGDPQVIIMDEPMVGLDPKQIIEIRELIRSLREGHTVILSSHILTEVRAVCDHIMILSHGRLMAADTPENLEKLFDSSLVLRLVARIGQREFFELAQTMELSGEAKYTPLEEGLARIEIPAREDSGKLAEEVFFAFAGKGCPILEMTSQKAGLESVFLELTQDNEKPAGEEEEHDGDL